jgi:hypothetical protein
MISFLNFRILIVYDTLHFDFPDSARAMSVASRREDFSPQIRARAAYYELNCNLHYLT